MYRRSPLVAALAVAVLALPAAARTEVYEDPARGFRVRVDDDFTQVPPKLTNDAPWRVAQWYIDHARYKSTLRPEIELWWFATPKGTVTPGGADEPPSPDGPPASPEALRERTQPKTLDEVVDRMTSGPYSERFFGPHVPMAERWGEAETTKTRGRHAVEYVEINPPSRKKRKRDEQVPPAWRMVARLTLDRAGETVTVAFVADAPIDHAEDLRKTFLDVVESFEELEDYTDGRNAHGSRALSDDPETRRKEIRKTKLIPGWAALDTENYLFLYDEQVDRRLVENIAEQIEAIRAQIYEQVFPPDEPITAVSVVRICKDRDQYGAYGGPGGSAGYWSSWAQELVFYEDQSNKKDSLRVLYHEAFHQYIYYSVGDFSPHSWFNEGHGDYFSGHDYEGRRFVEKPFLWRKDLAKTVKREGRVPPLGEWLRWTQREYYGRNERKLAGGENYALGWDFVWFLRTTRKPEYHGILDRYFHALKSRVRQARKAREGLSGAGDPAAVEEAMRGIGSPQEWLDAALEEAFRGVDMAQLERDWLDS